MSLPDEPVLYSVLDLTTRLREIVETHFADVRVEGELSNFRQYRSGHCYFTLKDDEAQLRCVMWRGVARYVAFEPHDGMLVRVSGNASVYEARGELQLVARSMQLAGEGALQRAFDELRQRLEAEGLFDSSRKQRLPAFPETIGLVTSGDGAALQDILSILSRRFPQVRVLLCPVHVQGVGASREIADAVEAFNVLPADDPMRPDVLVVGRGGGSAEDLWAFNEEVVARAIFASTIPVVSAVGHETDFSIADFVADVRAATPSMAAELIVPDRRDVEALVRGYAATLRDRLLTRIETQRRHVTALTHSYRFHRPVERLRQAQQRLDDVTSRLHRATRHVLNADRHRLEALTQRLALLDPQRPLVRGYVLVERDGTPVRRARDLQAGDPVSLRFLDGERPARIEA